MLFLKNVNQRCKNQIFAGRQLSSPTAPIGAENCGCKRGWGEEFQGNFHSKNWLVDVILG